MLTPREFESLARRRGRGLVTITLPTHRRSPDTRQDAIRLKNALAEARRIAEDRGLDVATVEEALGPARALLDDDLFWQHQGDGLALFAGGDTFDVHRLPYAVKELVSVGPRFHVRSLLPAVSRSHGFSVLALSQNAVRLLRCSVEGAHEVDLRDVPRRLGDVVGYDWEQKSLQFHTGTPGRGARRPAVFHGHGAGQDDSRAELEQFVRRVDQGVLELLDDREAPLVVAAAEPLLSLHRSVSRHPALVPGGLHGNVEHLDTASLHAKALEVVRPVLDAARRDVLQRVARSVPSQRIVGEVAEVLEAADQGRVGTLLVSSGPPVWGTTGSDGGDVEVHDERRPDDEDLLDAAVAKVVETSGDVDVLPETEDVGEGPVPLVALLRY